jgi:hypothetical protein
MPDQHGENAVSEESVSARLPWEAPKLIPLDLLSRAEKLTWNSEGGFASGLS